MTRKRKSGGVAPATASAGEPQLQNTVRLSGEGLAKVLGDLEARVLEAAWSIGEPASAREVHARVAKEHEIAVVTCITVLNRLVSKRILTRRQQDGLLHYQAVMSKDEFMAAASRRVMEGILSLGPDAVAASLVDVLASRDPKQLAELGRLVRRRLNGSTVAKRPDD